jgi:prepilin-type N-terminal cleavage/methylation domain-containing protein
VRLARGLLLIGGVRGYSLLEVLVATTIVAVGVAALAQLVSLATYATRGARQTTIAAILAQDKIEELLPDVSIGLTSSPGDALAQNLAGYSDYADETGRVVGNGPTPPVGSVYLRRWSVDSMPETSDGTSILQVLVADLRGRTLARFVAAKGKAF